MKFLRESLKSIFKYLNSVPLTRLSYTHPSPCIHADMDTRLRGDDELDFTFRVMGSRHNIYWMVLNNSTASSRSGNDECSRISFSKISCACALSPDFTRPAATWYWISGEFGLPASADCK